MHVSKSRERSLSTSPVPRAGKAPLWTSPAVSPPPFTSSITSHSEAWKSRCSSWEVAWSWEAALGSPQHLNHSRRSLGRQAQWPWLQPHIHPTKNHTDLWFLKIIIQSKNKKWVLILQQRTTASYTHHTCTGCPVRFRPCWPAHQVVCRGPSTLRPRVWASDMMQTSPGNCKDTDTVLEASFVTHGNGFPNLLILFITIITIW